MPTPLEVKAVLDAAEAKAKWREAHRITNSREYRRALLAARAITRH